MVVVASNVQGLVNVCQKFLDLLMLKANSLNRILSISVFQYYFLNLFLLLESVQAEFNCLMMTCYNCWLDWVVYFRFSKCGGIVCLTVQIGRLGVCRVFPACFLYDFLIWWSCICSGFGGCYLNFLLPGGFLLSFKRCLTLFALSLCMLCLLQVVLCTGTKWRVPFLSWLFYDYFRECRYCQAFREQHD